MLLKELQHARNPISYSVCCHLLAALDYHSPREISTDIINTMSNVQFVFNDSEGGTKCLDHMSISPAELVCSAGEDTRTLRTLGTCPLQYFWEIGNDIKMITV